MSYEDVSNYSDATYKFRSNAYSDNYRMKMFAQANSHCSDSDIITAIEQELYAFESEKKDAIVRDQYLDEVMHYVKLLKYYNKQRLSIEQSLAE